MKSALPCLLMGLWAATALGEGEPPGASFKEGVGVELSDFTGKFLGVETAAVEDRVITPDVRITAQVYREAREPSQNEGEPAGFTYASAWVEPAVAALLPAGTGLSVLEHPEATGAVLRLDHTAADASGSVEVLLQVRDDQHPWRIGEFIRATPNGADGATVTVVPRAAVLDTAYGPFVYTVNGGAYLRTAVSIGARHEETVEIRDGLYSGDEVVVHPVETLYLIELRATKGGGHSH